MVIAHIYDSLLTLSTQYSSKVALVEDCLLSGKINDGGTTLRRPGGVREESTHLPMGVSAPERCNALVLFGLIACRYLREPPILLVTRRFINEVRLRLSRRASLDPIVNMVQVPCFPCVCSADLCNG